MFHLLALSFLAASASAADFAEDGAGTDTQDPIVIEGQRERDVERQVRRFIGSRGASRMR